MNEIIGNTDADLTTLLRKDKRRKTFVPKIVEFKHIDLVPADCHLEFATTFMVQGTIFAAPFTFKSSTQETPSPMLFITGRCEDLQAWLGEHPGKDLQDAASAILEKMLLVILDFISWIEPALGPAARFQLFKCFCVDKVTKDGVDYSVLPDLYKQSLEDISES